MTLGDDPFRKRDVPPQDPGTPGAEPPPYASHPYGTPPYGSPSYESPPSGSPPSGSQPYGYPPYAAPYPPYGSQYAPPGQPPSGHLGWAIVAVIFFWPLAIAAFINYGRVESRWYRGDAVGAQQASDAVKRFGVIALGVGLLIMLLYIIFAASIFSGVSSCGPGGIC